MLITRKGSGATWRRERMRCRPCRRKQQAASARNARKKKQDLPLEPVPWHGRFTLPRPFLSYKEAPKCPRCGSTDVYSVEKERRAEIERWLASGMVCACELLPFRHVKGRNKFCEHHEDRRAGIPFTEEEYEHLDEIRKGSRGAHDNGENILPFVEPQEWIDIDFLHEKQKEITLTDDCPF